MMFLLEVSGVIVALFLGMIFTPVATKRVGGNLLRDARSPHAFGRLVPRRRFRH